MKPDHRSRDRGRGAARRLLTFAWLLALSPLADAATVYVSGDSAENGPGSEWSNAFHDIQGALGVATNAGDLVLVSNGVYAAGGAIAGGISNRVVVPAGVTLQSVGGAAVTTIRAAGTMGPLAMRGVYLANQAVLDGFTVEGGTSDTVLGAGAIGAYGGGIFCLSTAATVRRCVVQDNTALSLGGGVYYGTVYNSILQRNSAAWGGAAFHADLYNCLVADNVAPTNAYWPTCGSAGVEYGTHYNCTVVRNRSHSRSWHAGLSQATAYNCIVYDNEPNDRTPGPAYYSCIQKPSGVYVPPTGTITNRPQFVDAVAGHYELAETSPCRDRGTNETWMVGTRDLSDRPRTMNGRVDMGAYEFDTGEVEPAILVQPRSQTVVLGQAFLISITATGTPEPKYAWLKNGMAMGGFSSQASIGAPAALMFHAGEYVCLVSNMAGTVSSEPAILTVERKPQTIAFVNPGDQIVTNQVVLSASASSGLGVSVEVAQGPAQLPRPNIHVVTFTGTGLVALVATQAGDTTWAPAANVTNLFRVTAVPLDTDGDGLPDDVERALGTDPDRPDSDNDGMQDGAELIAGTDPTNTLDRLEIRGADLGGNNGAPVIGWASVSGRFYEVLSCTNLLEAWSNTVQLPGDGLWLAVTNPPGDVVPRYFRLTVTTNSAAP